MLHSLKTLKIFSNEEKIFYNALNSASESNLPLLSALKKQLASFKKIWETDEYQFLFRYNRFEKETIQKLIERKAEIKPEAEWQRLVELDVELILLEDNSYPELLKEINEPPLGIYQLGIYSIEKPKIAVVGTRKATNYGKSVTEKITKELARTGFTIVSGLAWGIDTFSHLAALEVGTETLAVLGSGLDVIFPSVNKKLAKKIIQQGALISEYPLAAPALKHHFPERNRIISGLGLGVVVIEAPLKSGALITARFALEQNREVFAIPGPIFSKNSEGTNELIKAGAKLVNKVEDILIELNIPIQTSATSTASISLSPEEEKILEIIKKTEQPLNVDEIIEKSGWDAATVNQYLTFLELKNLIKLDSGGYRIKF